MAEQQHVYLIPGFFGFVNLGQIVYFSHVERFLPRALAERGVDATVTIVQSEPTASLRKRAARVVEAIAAGGPGPVHLIGHSTGGLDARLALTPKVELPTEAPVAGMAARVRSAISISTPHYGTPLATFFSGMYGKQALELLSLVTIYALRFGRLPISALLRLGALLVRLDDHLGWRDTIADQAFEQLLSDFTPERRDDLRSYLEHARADQGLMGQLTPEGIDLINAAATDRRRVRYGCVVSAVAPAGLRSAWRLGLDPYAQATHGLFIALNRITSRRADKLELARPTLEQREMLRPLLGRDLRAGDNDGVVPALSQLRGELIAAAQADHLDVIGHYRGDGQQVTPGEIHYDWFSSGSSFAQAEFATLWRRVAEFVAETAT